MGAPSSLHTRSIKLEALYSTLILVPQTIWSNDQSLICETCHHCSKENQTWRWKIWTSTVKRTLKLGDMVLHSVLYIPQLSDNLISVSGTTGGTWRICKNSATLFDPSGKQVITAQMQNGLYPIKVSHLAHSLSAMANTPSTPLTDLHQRLGHLNVRSFDEIGSVGKDIWIITSFLNRNTRI